jgi:hypothetical protein
MSELAANSPSIATAQARRPQRILTPVQWRILGFGLLFVALCVGWLLRDRGIVNPEHGLGYWLGITGGSLMLILVLYPGLKKSKTLRRLGWSKHSFRVHMLIGLIGPTLILYHCNFQVDAINSAVALYSMLLVAGSGIVGRYFYSRIHRGLYGKRASIEDLRREMGEALENSRGIAAILPDFTRELHTISAGLMGDKYTRKLRVWESLSWTYKHWLVRLRLHTRIRRELRARAMVSEVIRAKSRELRRTANAYMRQQVRLMRRIAQLALYERLFSLWHMFHMPLFVLLIVSALVHVVAVHMY